MFDGSVQIRLATANTGFLGPGGSQPCWWVLQGCSCVWVPHVPVSVPSNLTVLPNWTWVEPSLCSITVWDEHKFVLIAQGKVHYIAHSYLFYFWGFFGIIYLLVTWEFHKMHPNHTHFPDLQGLALILLIPPHQQRRKKTEQNRKHKSNSCCPYTYGITAKISVASP